MRLTERSLRRWERLAAEIVRERRYRDHANVKVTVLDANGEPITDTRLANDDRPLRPDATRVEITFTASPDDGFEERVVTPTEAFDRAPSESRHQDDVILEAIAQRAPEANEAAPSEPTASGSTRRRVKFGTNKTKDRVTLPDGTTAWVSRGHRDLTVPTNFSSVSRR